MAEDRGHDPQPGFNRSHGLANRYSALLFYLPNVKCFVINPRLIHSGDLQNRVTRPPVRPGFITNWWTQRELNPHICLAKASCCRYHYEPSRPRYLYSASKSQCYSDFNCYLGQSEFSAPLERDGIFLVASFVTIRKPHEQVCWRTKYLKLVLSFQAVTMRVAPLRGVRHIVFVYV